MKEYLINAVGGCVSFGPFQSKVELIDAIDALIGTLYNPEKVVSREKSDEFLGGAYSVCHEDFYGWTRQDHLGKQARIYVVGNGDICIGRKAAIMKIEDMGIFTHDESRMYIDNVKNYKD